MKHNLKSISDLGISNNPRAPHADITNAGELFGDPFGGEWGDFDEEDGDAFEDGDFEDGDFDLYGDINDSTLGVFKQISGDPLMGGPKFKAGMAKAKAFGRKYRAPLIAGGAAVGTAVGLRAFKKAVARKKAQRAKVSRQLMAQRSKQTLRNQKMVQENAGKISRNSKMPFFEVIGAKLNSSPIDPLSSFVADMFKYNLDRQNSDTPFYQETAIGTFALGTWTAQANGTASNRYWVAAILQIGINYLNAAPGTIFQVTATLPTINGTLVVSTTPWIFTISKGYDVRFKFFPWQLVSNKPLLVLGQYSNANPIIVQVTGLPSASAVNLVVPGSLHPWSIAMRNALI